MAGSAGEKTCSDEHGHNQGRIGIPYTLLSFSISYSTLLFSYRTNSVYFFSASSFSHWNRLTLPDSPFVPRHVRSKEDSFALLHYGLAVYYVTKPRPMRCWRFRGGARASDGFKRPG